MNLSITGVRLELGSVRSAECRSACLSQGVSARPAVLVGSDRCTAISPASARCRVGAALCRPAAKRGQDLLRHRRSRHRVRAVHGRICAPRRQAKAVASSAALAFGRSSDHSRGAHAADRTGDAASSTVLARAGMKTAVSRLPQGPRPGHRGVARRTRGPHGVAESPMSVPPCTPANDADVDIESPAALRSFTPAQLKRGARRSRRLAASWRA